MAFFIKDVRSCSISNRIAIYLLVFLSMKLYFLPLFANHCGWNRPTFRPIGCVPNKENQRVFVARLFWGLHWRALNKLAKRLKSGRPACIGVKGPKLTTLCRNMWLTGIMDVMSTWCYTCRIIASKAIDRPVGVLCRHTWPSNKAPFL